jgi:acyl transferase domain-containing protein
MPFPIVLRPPAAWALKITALLPAEIVSVAFRKSGMLAADGRCKTLDASADGYVRAEAAGAMLLELAAEAHLAESKATMLLLSSAVNQDGRSNGLTAPNGPAQQEVLRAALGTAGLAPQAINAVQLHGTGTSLGDPIELGALAAVFAGAQSAKPLALMAGKSLVGHSEPAAGMMGLAHAHLSVASGASLPILHLQAGKTLVSLA